MKHRLHVPATESPYLDEVRRAPEAELGEFESLYREHAERLWRSVMAYAQDREVASDAVAEAFAQCLQRGRAVRDPGRWVWRAAFRIAAGELKERRMRTVMDEIPDMSQETDELLSSLALLPPRQRAALVLHYYAGYRAREIAGIVGSTAPTVRVHLSQGRKRLRRLLEADDD